MTHYLKHIAHIVLAALILAPLSLLAVAEEDAAPAGQPAGRAMALQLEAEVVAIDLDTREVSLKGPDGNVVTITAREHLVKLEDVSVGDVLVVTYLASLEGEVREPTELELAQPWVVLEEGGMSDDPAHPGVAGARVIRAVVTIEGMNRELGTVMVKDSRGKLHVIGDVEPEKMNGVTLGQQAVIVYTEALALSLEKKPAAQ